LVWSGIEGNIGWWTRYGFEKVSNAAIKINRSFPSNAWTMVTFYLLVVIVEEIAIYLEAELYRERKEGARPGCWRNHRG
jgi:hypothetical protein